MNGFDFTEFDKLVSNVERLGADMNKVSKSVLDAGSIPAREAFAKKIPYDTTTPSQKRKHRHARDNVNVSRTRTSVSGSKYRLIEAEDKEFVYLWFQEHGTANMEARHFRSIAIKAAKEAAHKPMEKALLTEIERLL